jgi:4-carboxymuconolactone decarboxylase
MRNSIPILALALLSAVAPLHALAQERLPPIKPENMTEAQKKAVAKYKEERKVDTLTGPFAVLARVPDLLVPSLEIRLHNQQNSALPAKLTELSILLAAQHYGNNYEFNAHDPMARKAGLEGPVITAIADGRRPDGMTEDEAIVYDFCTELNWHYSVSDATYARALAKFGEAGIVEATTLEGYYAYLALVMNVARTPMPAGAKPPLAKFPKNQ